MELSIQYDELSTIIRDKTNHDVQFKYISSDTLEVSQKIIRHTTKIGVNIKLLGFKGTNFQVKASSNFLDMILSWLPYHKFTEFVSMDNGVVTVALSKIEQLQKVLAMMQPTQIVLDEKSIHLKAKLV